MVGVFFIGMASVLPSNGYSKPQPPRASFKQSSVQAPPNTSYWAITAANLESAACVRREPFSESEMLSWLNTQAQRAGATVPEARVSGIRFIDEHPAMIRLFKDLVTYSGYKRYSQSQQAEVLTSTCTQVICAAEDIFGKKTGIQLLYLLGRFGINGSHLAFDDADAWRSDELDDVLVGFAAYPDFLNSQFYNEPFIHHPRELENGMTMANAQGVFSSWNRLSRPERYFTITHERAHRFNKLNIGDSSQELDETPEWYRLSGWTSEDPNPHPMDIGPFHLAHPDWAPSAYARTKPREDFAESITKYRFDPAGFLRILGRNGRAKYDYIREKIFGGVEFLSEADCGGSFQAHAQASAASIQPRSRVQAQPSPGLSPLPDLPRKNSLTRVSPPTAPSGKKATTASPDALKEALQAIVDWFMSLFG